MRKPGPMDERLLPAVGLTRGPRQHFFGYYDRTPFDASGRYLLGLECDDLRRPQRPEDTATVGLVDTEQGNRWVPLAETLAWNWQMGCMAEWLPGTDRKIIYNDRRQGRLVSVILDAGTRDEQMLPSPVFEVSPDGRSALTLNFARLWDVRPETGYCGMRDPWSDQAAPDEDGVFRMDLASGETTLLVSHRDMAALAPVAGWPGGLKRYFTHLLFNEDGSRFLFWYRVFSSGGRAPSPASLLCTASPEGKDLCLLNAGNSHCTWLGKDRVVAWTTHRGAGPHTWVFEDRTARYERLGAGVLEVNGHATFSPDRQWLLTDAPPDSEGKRALVLYHLASQRAVVIGRLDSPPEFAGPLRCDLHPRWDRDGVRVSLDSTHEGARQMYLVAVGSLTGAAGT